MIDRPLELICGCGTTCQREDGSYEILDVGRGSKCHKVGDVISGREAVLIRLNNAEWEQAEADYLEQE
jgi:hypothetical protein